MGDGGCLLGSGIGRDSALRPVLLSCDNGDAAAVSVVMYALADIAAAGWLGMGVGDGGVAVA